MKPYTLRGTPDPRVDKGVRLLSLREIDHMMRTNPFAREGMERINRKEGVPRLAAKVIHEQDTKNRAIIENNKFGIDQMLKKQKGLYD